MKQFREVEDSLKTDAFYTAILGYAIPAVQKRELAPLLRQDSPAILGTPKWVAGRFSSKLTVFSGSWSGHRNFMVQDT